MDNVSTIFNFTEKLGGWGALAPIGNLTDEITYLVFDNQLIKTTVGITNLSQLLLIYMSIFAITLGSYASIQIPPNALPPSEDHPLFDPTDKDCMPIEKGQEISTGIALILPVLAGMALLCMYYFAKKHGGDTISYFFSKYVIIISFTSVSFMIGYVYNNICRNIANKYGIQPNVLNKRYAITLSEDVTIHPIGIEPELALPQDTEEERIIREEKLLENREPISPKNQLVNVYLTSGNVLGYFVGIVFSVLFKYYNGENNWILNNILGVCVVVTGIKSTKVPNFKIATILLTLFFVYDIYFVFGTDVMVTVATQVEIPVKLIMPHYVNRETDEVKLLILGLGDLTLPGIFIALCLRFDLFRHHGNFPNTEFHLLQRFERPYFKAAMFGYVGTLLLTLKVAEIYKVGQPALLYLCPGIIISVFTTALSKGEFGKLWEYQEMEEELTYKKTEESLCSEETLRLVSEINENNSDDSEDPDYEIQEEENDDDDDDDDDGQEEQEE